MSIKRFTADEARRHARVDLDRLKEVYDADMDTVEEEADVSPLSGPELMAKIESGEARTTELMDVAAIRAKTGLSQGRFARTFDISVATLRNWEQRRRVPEGPARTLLRIIDRETDAAMRALDDGKSGNRSRSIQ
jgi:putative transcriptional regulator